MKERSYKYSPKESEELDSLIEDSYVKFVQLERRNLLVISFILLFSFFTKVNPAKGTFLGLSFDQFQEVHYYITLMGLLLYFLLAFIIYAYPHYQSALSKKSEILKKAHIMTRCYKWWQPEWSRLKLDLKYFSWLWFHYYFPVFIAILALIFGTIKIV